MPLIDMPVEELFAYQGRNPRPQDFDDYWARALNQMHALGTACRRVPAELEIPGVRCEDLWFTGVGGAQVYAKLLVPEGAKDRPALLCFHGYTGSSGDWSDYLHFAALGFVVAALDCRGQGGRSEDVGGVKGTTLRGAIIRGLSDPDPDKLLMRNVLLDTAQLARIVMALDEVDSGRVGATGGSQGGALTLACAALEPSIRRAAAMYPFLSDYQRVWEMDLTENAYREIRDYFRKFDPRHLRQTETFTKLGYIDIQHLAPRIRADTLMYTGLMDKTCPPSSQFAAYNKITASKAVHFWPDFAHETLPGAADMTLAHMLKL